MREAAIGRGGRVLAVLVALGCGSSNSNPSHPPPAPDGGGTGAAADAAGPITDAAVGDIAVSVGEAGLLSLGRLFPEDSPWYRDITDTPADVESPAMIASLTAAGGFGGGEFLIDFSFELNTADGAAPLVPLVPGPDFSTPDCDATPVPLPPGGALRGEMGYQCTMNGECHLLVHQPGAQRMFELWKANVQSGVLTAGCLAVWDLSRSYGPSGRGTDCASADSSGMPIAALLFNADEVAGGEIPHALRLSLPVDRIRPGVYVSPATHTTRSSTGSPTAVPLGARLRLRPDFPTDGLSRGAKVVVKALQSYGMLLAEGGPRALTAEGDRKTAARWAGLLGDRDLVGIKPADFVVVDSGPRIKYSGDCVRSP
jgi:serine/threonine-protein kinase